MFPLWSLTSWAVFNILRFWVIFILNFISIIFLFKYKTRLLIFIKKFLHFKYFKVHTFSSISSYISISFIVLLTSWVIHKSFGILYIKNLFTVDDQPIANSFLFNLFSIDLCLVFLLNDLVLHLLASFLGIYIVFIILYIACILILFKSNCQI